jgi:hypothetical protein
VAKRGVFPFGAVFAHEPRSALLLAWGTGLAVDAFDRGHDEPCRAVLAFGLADLFLIKAVRALVAIRLSLVLLRPTDGAGSAARLCDLVCARLEFSRFTRFTVRGLDRLTSLVCICASSAQFAVGLTSTVTAYYSCKTNFVVVLSSGAIRAV